jgi:hypothetical protein
MSTKQNYSRMVGNAGVIPGISGKSGHCRRKAAFMTTMSDDSTGKTSLKRKTSWFASGMV